MAKNKKAPDLMSKLVALCKRRGIVFQSSEIYGGVGATYDYGPYGAPIKDNIARLWVDDMVLFHENIVQLDSAVILHPKVWEASGHLKEFTDPLIECSKCKGRYHADLLINSILLDAQQGYKGHPFVKDVQNRFHEQSSERIVKSTMTGADLQPIWEQAFSETLKKQGWNGVQCPSCGTTGTLSEPRKFNLMFQTRIGSASDSAKEGFIRPETAQGIYLDYKTVQLTSRQKIPFGIAQIGKAFRNEITPGNFIFRTIEFEQMEMQYFIRPGENRQWVDYWKERRWNWYLSLGVNPNKLRWYKHPDDKLAHYAQEAWDIEYDFPFGWSELEGIHDRGEYDLSAHQNASGKDMTYFDDQSKERFIPNIVETSAGLNRTMLLLLVDAYREDEQAGEERVYLALDPKVAPIKAAILPLVKKDGIADIGREIVAELRRNWRVFFDAQGSIGRRYRRMDEIGTPFAFTVDYQTKEDGTVTVRWRDTLQQERIGKDRIDQFLIDKLGRI